MTQGDKSWQSLGEHNANIFFRVCYFRDICVVFARNYKFSISIQKERKEYRKEVKRSLGFNYVSKSNHEILHDFTKDQTKTNIIEVQKEILCVLKV